MWSSEWNNQSLNRKRNQTEKSKNMECFKYYKFSQPSLFRLLIFEGYAFSPPICFLHAIFEWIVILQIVLFQNESFSLKMEVIQQQCWRLSLHQYSCTLCCIKFALPPLKTRKSFRKSVIVNKQLMKILIQCKFSSDHHESWSLKEINSAMIPNL